MLKLALIVIVEAFIGVAAAGVLLAVVVPLLIRYGVIVPGALAGSVVIAAVLMFAIGAALLRPGSALRHRGTRER